MLGGPYGIFDGNSSTTSPSITATILSPGTPVAVRSNRHTPESSQDTSIRWDLHDLGRLEYFEHRDEGRVRRWRSIHVTDGGHPHMDKWWVPGLHIGYEHSFVHQIADFLTAMGEGKPCSPTFAEGIETQKVCDAVLKSAAENRWIEVGS